jgi:hypothetical protein
MIPLLSAAAISAAVFNLVCGGTKTELPASGSLAERLEMATHPPPGRPAEVEFRVDLNRHRWCFHDACDMSFPIAELSDTRIVLLADERPAGDHMLGNYIEANRESGEFLMRHSGVQAVEVTKGTCTRRNSPGLPELKF